MLEDDDNDFNKHCTTFHALLDTDQMIESYIVEYTCDKVKVSETSGKTEAHILLVAEQTLSENQDETTWAALPVNVVESEDQFERPTEDVYEPAHAWERPAGHSVKGVDKPVHESESSRVTCMGNPLWISMTALLTDPSLRI